MKTGTHTTVLFSCNFLSHKGDKKSVWHQRMLANTQASNNSSKQGAAAAGQELLPAAVLLAGRESNVAAKRMHCGAAIAEACAHGYT